MNENIGSVSHGTMRPEDLIPVFIAHLPAGTHRDTYQAAFENLTGDPDRAEQEQWLLEDLFDALDGLAPAGHSFGAHPGDGSDYGWWPIEDDDDENG